MDVLQLDVSGRPQAWLSVKDAAVLYASQSVAWTLGEPFMVLRGGIQRRTGLQSRLALHPIIAVHGAMPSRAWRTIPSLTNPKLFARDRQMCAYCGDVFPHEELTREHILPTSRGGADTWMNCITACKLCPPKCIPVYDVSEFSRGKIPNARGSRIRSGYQLDSPVRRAVQ